MRSPGKRLILLMALGAALTGGPAAEAKLPPGFADRVVLEGLEQPTSAEYAPDGRIYVSEKRGVLMRFAGPGDDTPRIVADLRTEVHDFHDRGLLSVVADPGYPRRPYLYVAYTHDARVGGVAPLWGKPGVDHDRCLAGNPDPSVLAGCEVSSRVSRLRIGAGGGMTGERVLLEDWCQQFLSHSIGDLAFDRQGALLISAGEGASYIQADTGQRGDPPNQCGDPPSAGGALRAQDLITDGDPLGLDGTIVRIDPRDGSPVGDGGGSAEGPNADRIIAYGLRNPFRFAIRPGSDEVWIGDVGWVAWEEINVLAPDRLTNFGWPCYEGDGVQPSYDALDAPICEGLYAAAEPAVKQPWLAYAHRGPLVEGEGCAEGVGVSAISGITFDRGPRFPQPFDGALFFTDYTRGCIWSVEAGRLGRPRPASLRAFDTRAQTPVDLEQGPGGLLYVDIFGGAIRRIAYERRTVELSLRSRPAGGRLRLDSRTVRGRPAITLARGTRHRVRAPARIVAGRRVLSFERWSDGGARSHSIRATDDATLRAIYR